MLPSFYSIPPHCLRSNQHWLISTRCAVLPEGALEEVLKFDSNVMTVEEDEEGDSLTIMEWYKIPNSKRVKQPIAMWSGEKQKLVLLCSTVAFFAKECRNSEWVILVQIRLLNTLL